MCSLFKKIVYIKYTTRNIVYDILLEDILRFSLLVILKTSIFLKNYLSFLLFKYTFLSFQYISISISLLISYGPHVFHLFLVHVSVGPEC
jgi:hypothetical protein